MNKLSIAISYIIMAVTSPFVFAGSLEPSAPPASSMKSLDEVLPTWNQKLMGSERYELALAGDAVLDKETGLVWEQTPRPTQRQWSSAVEYCYNRGTGGRAGWHLPTAPEMGSLFDWDASLPLSSGHPFSVPDLNNCAGTVCQFWTATTVVDSAVQAYIVRIEVTSDTWYAARPEDKTTSLGVWCVRGGSGHIGP